MPNSVSGLLFLIHSCDTRPTYKYLHLFGRRTRSAPFKSLSFGDDDLTIIHSCNGLLLCSSTINTEIGKKNYYACNPTTKQLALIPPPHPSFVVKPTAPPSMNLVFHLATAPHYKIVLVHYHSKFGYQIQIYSSETGIWRLSGDPFTAIHDHGFKSGVFLNGTIHWTSSLSEISFRFDVDRECLETMPMPPFQGDRNYRLIRYFGESGGHLHLICNEHHKITPFDVLEMESDYSNWFVKFHVDLDAIKTTFPVFKRRCPYFKILHIVREKVEESSYLLLFYVDCLVLSYCFSDVKVKKICNSLRSVDFHSHQYIEALFRI